MNDSPVDCSRKKIPSGEVPLGIFWCGRRELNPYGKTTRPSNVRVCQFRHSRRTVGIISQLKRNVKGFLKSFLKILKKVFKGSDFGKNTEARHEILRDFRLLSFFLGCIACIECHFAKCVASVAKLSCDLGSAFSVLAKLRIEHRLVNYVSKIALSEIGHEDGKINSAHLADLCKHNHALVEALKLGKISLVASFGECNDVVTVLKSLNALSHSLYESCIVIGGNKIKTAIKEMRERACDDAEETCEVKVPMLFLVIVNSGLIFIE